MLGSERLKIRIALWDHQRIYLDVPPRMTVKELYAYIKKTYPDLNTGWLNWDTMSIGSLHHSISFRNDAQMFEVKEKMKEEPDDGLLVLW